LSKIERVKFRPGPVPRQKIVDRVEDPHANDRVKVRGEAATPAARGSG
jgi:hypothetical protein